MLKVIARNRLGNTTEDITYITSGPLAQHIAVMDGYDVLAVPAPAKDLRPARKLFDVRAMGIKVAPRGISYLESESLFVFNDISQRSTLFLADIEGRPQGTRAIQYLSGFTPDQLEGIAALRQSQAAEQLIMAALKFTPNLESRLEALSLVDKSAYRVVSEIFPADPVGTDFVSGVIDTIPILPREPARFLVSYGNIIQAVASDGSLPSSPVELKEAFVIEGLARTDTNIFAADVIAGKLFAFDQSLSRLPKLDRDYKIGVGLFNSFGLAWNASADQHLLVSFSTELPESMQISEVPPSLDSARRLVDLTASGFRRARRMTYLTKEKLIAVAHQRDPRAILLFDNQGKLVETIDLTAIGSPVAVAYIPTTGEFAVRVSEQARTIFIVTRAGATVRAIELSSSGIRSVVALTFFNSAHTSGGQFLIVDGPLAGDPIIDLAFVTDFDGKPLNKINYREELGALAPADVATITSGANAGALSIVDRASNELVVFELDSAIGGGR